MRRGESRVAAQFLSPCPSLNHVPCHPLPPHACQPACLSACILMPACTTSRPSICPLPQFFTACQAKDAVRWLACLHASTREAASSLRPGPYDVCQWELGRARMVKYLARYVFKRQVGEQQIQVRDLSLQVRTHPCTTRPLSLAKCPQAHVTSLILERNCQSFR